MGGKIGRYLIIHDQQKLLTKRTKQKESYAQHHLLLTFRCLSQDWALLSHWWHVSSFSSFLFAVFDGCQFPEKGTTRNWNRDDCFGEDHPAMIWYIFLVFLVIWGYCWFFSLLHMNLKFNGQCLEDAEILIIVWPETCLELTKKYPSMFFSRRVPVKAHQFCGQEVDHPRFMVGRMQCRFLKNLPKKCPKRRLHWPKKCNPSHTSKAQLRHLESPGLRLELHLLVATSGQPWMGRDGCGL